MEPTDAAAVIVIAAAVWGVFRGWDVRLVLLAAALALGGLAGDIAPVVRTFLDTFSNEKFVVPICSAMGFAYVLRHTGCDRHLVRALVEPVRRVRPLTVPGVVLAGFVVNVPVISQTSTAVCLGAVVVPVMRAAGFGPAATGSALLLGASVGGELLNPGAPELLTVKDKTGVDTREIVPYVVPLVLPVLAVSTLVLWVTVRASPERPPKVPEPPAASAHEEPLNPLKAVVPVVPLALLFLSGPPLSLFEIPLQWLAEPKAAAAATSRLIALAMLVGVGAAAVVAPCKAGGCMKAFFEGGGYGFTHIVSLIVTANCFGKGIELVKLADHLGGLIAAEPRLLHPLAGLVPWAFAWVCGSGMASTQSLYGFFHGPATAAGADPVAVGAMVSVGAAAGRTMSPVAAVTLMCATLVGVNPWELLRRVGPALVAGLTAAVLLRTLGLV
jgi:DcuC family C4-dicarboxylate transporter